MKFAIRDDDTCFFTSPDDLGSVYEDIWEWVPITLACVPYVTPDSDVIYDTSGCNRKEPIGSNEKLVSYLTDQLNQERIEISLHGYHHDTPRGRPEFVTGDDLARKARLGKEHLEKIFDTPITTFVPPHGRLSRRGVRAIERIGLNVAREYGPRPREFTYSPGWIRGFATFLRHHLTAGRAYRLIEPVSFGGHEALFCYRLNESTDMETCLRAMEYAADKDGAFCISVHAGGMDELAVEKLECIVDRARDSGFTPTTVDGIFNK